MLVAASLQVRWGLRNGVWVLGADSFPAMIRDTRRYTIADCADQIDTPTLILDAEGDQFLNGQPLLVEKALTGAATTLVTLTNAEGAGEHTHAGAVSRAHQVMFDWLDATLID
jgi:hypothetical protein